MENIENSFSEVFDILNNMEKELYNKIPKKFIKFIDDNRNREYIPNIDYSKSIAEQNILHDTEIILSIIYRKYLCDENQKIQLQHLDNVELEDYQKMLEKKYEIDFSKRTQQIRDELQNVRKDTNENVPNVITKPKWYQGLVDKVLKLFKIK